MSDFELDIYSEKVISQRINRSSFVLKLSVVRSLFCASKIFANDIFSHLFILPYSSVIPLGEQIQNTVL